MKLWRQCDTLCLYACLSVSLCVCLFVLKTLLSDLNQIVMTDLWPLKYNLDFVTDRSLGTEKIFVFLQHGGIGRFYILNRITQKAVDNSS